MASKKTGVLITGGSGYLGQALQARLKRDESLQVWAPSRAELDLEKDWSSFVTPFPIDTIIHAAASRGRSDPGAHRFPEETRINVDASARLYDWARQRRVANVIHISTISVLTPSTDLAVRIDEETPLDRPPHPYALTKRWAEDLLSALSDELESIAIVRPGSIYGPNTPERSLIARMAAAVQAGEARTIAAPKGNVLAPVFIDDVVDVIANLVAEPDEDEIRVNVVGPDAVFELEMMHDLAKHFGREAKIDLDAEAEAVALAPSTKLVDELFPNRTRTPWLAGMARAFPR